MKKSFFPLKWVVWFLASLFYFYEYLLRISPSVMIGELMQAFSVDAAAIGVMVAFYLYAYAPMQLVVGILMDQFGAKKLLTLASFTCGIGSIIFGLSGYITFASFGRLLIGAGSAFAFVGMVFICSHLFPKKQRALMIGLANSIGMCGAVTGGGPLSVIISHYPWRPVMEILGAVGILLALGIYLFYIDHKTDVEDATMTSALSLIKKVCSNPYAWINSIVASLFYLSTSTFGGLWGISFLQASYGFSKQTAGFAMSMVFVGWLIGGPLTGLISDAIRKRKEIIFVAILLSLICLISVIYIPGLSLPAIYILLFFLGVFSSAELLHFSYAIEITPQKMKGTAVAFTNGVVSLCESAAQPLIGWLLVFYWSGIMKDNVPLYSSSDYKHALMVLPLGLFIALVLSLTLKERPYKEEASPHSSFIE